MAPFQPGILAPVPAVARHLVFSQRPDVDPRDCLEQLAQQADGTQVVVGLGHSLLQGCGVSLNGMREMPALSGAAVEVPSAPAALWIWLRGDDRGVLVNLSRTLRTLLAPAFDLRDAIDCFMYRDSRDLSGYIDGTENPQEEDAVQAAILGHDKPGLDGSSFVAVQQWLHNLNHFNALSLKERDNIFGRHQADNEEFDSAPDSAHVKRTAQESFSPPAFMVRRSMPWNDATRDGLVFVAFGHSLDAFETVLKRMVGMEDGITDGLFRFTQPLNGAYFWCPPVSEGTLDLSLLKR